MSNEIKLARYGKEFFIRCENWKVTKPNMKNHKLLFHNLMH